ncbi:Uma2 family endonuclease [Kutzneria viridogrisea]|uniref:Uma2 family endonuclease n=1 Tax=Kutzneria viridogrisea TaxID=47990 RepID=A0ABR6BRU9_9PSEU|nr:Uma2 family endonuclease [Kutzneria viridogrisea]
MIPPPNPLGELLTISDYTRLGETATDYRTKREEYAEAGIPHYWIVDIEEPASLTACQLTKEFGYQDSQEITGEFTATTPFPVTVRLDQLL